MWLVADELANATAESLASAASNPGALAIDHPFTRYRQLVALATRILLMNVRIPNVEFFAREWAKVPAEVDSASRSDNEGTFTGIPSEMLSAAAPLPAHLLEEHIDRLGTPSSQSITSIRAQVPVNQRHRDFASNDVHLGEFVNTPRYLNTWMAFR
jgi:hypothetical protein